MVKSSDVNLIIRLAHCNESQNENNIIYMKFIMRIRFSTGILLISYQFWCYTIFKIQRSSNK